MNAIELNEITKIYGKQRALDKVTLNIKHGGVLGLLGPNGAGKSTLMKIITTFIPPTSGSATVNGYDIRENSIEVRKLVGYLPENNPLYYDMYVREYLEMVLKMYPGKHDVKKRVDEMIGITGLGPEQKKKIGALSKGYQQRVGLAQAMIHNPEILILDEPTSALDPNQLVDIRNIITNLGKEKTVILSTHIMQEVEAVCDRVVIINKGKIVAYDDMVNLTTILTGGGNRYVLELKESVDETVLLTIDGIRKVEKNGKNSWTLISDESDDLRETIFRFSVSKSWNVLSLLREEQNMEDVFHKLTMD
jgi:ABC-2 type transport system ATP-binding protein